SLDYRKDVRILGGKRWPTAISAAQFRQVTGEAEFPPELKQWVHASSLDYFGNNSVHYTLRGVDIQLDILWNWEAASGAGDVYEAAFRGTRSRIEVRQGKEENFQPEIYMVPASAPAAAEVFSALKKKVDSWQRRWPGLDVSVRNGEARLNIPAKY